MASRQNYKRTTTGKYRYVVSACLAGIDCTFSGGNKLNNKIILMVKSGVAVPVCPEVIGGSSIPRERCEIIAGSGSDVLCGHSVVRTVSGKDVTDKMVTGAERTLELVRSLGITRAILKSKSPSCGLGKIYDGSFKGRLRCGNGVTAELLLKNNIRVFTERQRRLWQAKSIL